MKRSGMIRRIIITLMIITFLSGNLGGLAEGILPSLTQDTRTAMPSIGEALQRNPDSETENADGSVIERYTNISNADYETFSVYLQEQGTILADYKLEDNVLTAEIRANDSSFFLNYNLGSGEAMVTYPAGAYGKKAQKAETQPVAEEQKGNSALIMKVGDNVTFGRYEQDNDLTNGPEEIEWIVLDYDKNNYKALLISKYGLDVHVYHEYGEVTWETCDLRKWLNNSFLNEAFSREEQNAILMTEVDNSSSQGYSGWEPVGGNNTQDQVFLLSCAEADLYFGVGTPGDENLNRRMAPTPYALARGAFTDGVRLTAENIPAGHWWLRSPGAKPTEAADIIEFGDCQSKPVMVEECIRPAIWVNSESIEGLTEEIETNNNQETADEEKTPVQEDKQEDTAEETAEENPDDAKNKDAMASYKRAGSIITFGAYEQDNDLINGLEPIEWLVLTYDEKENKALLISKYGLDTIGDLEDGITTWADCSQRKWLNEYFVYSAFSQEERKAVLITEVDDIEGQDHQAHEKGELQYAQDRVFLLSKREAALYLGVTDISAYESQNVRARVAPTPYAIAQGAFVSDEFKTAEGLPAGSWLIRINRYDTKGCNVNEGGTTREDELEPKRGGGLPRVARPAIWLDLNALEGLLSSAEERKDDENPKEAEREAKVAEYSRVGSIVTFGSYEQDNNLENGLEPIEWIVLDYDGESNRSLLISKYGLDTIAFDEASTKKDITWEDCKARKWLNQYFFYSAFSQEERKAMLITEVDDSESQDRLRHEKRELQNTQDRIFLLSKREAAIYLGVTDISPYENQDSRARVAPTPYAIAQGAYVSDEFNTAEGLPAGTWLLRTYLYDCQGMYVNEGGTTVNYELEPKRGGGEPHVACPVFWLDLNVLEELLSFAEAKKDDENPKEEGHEAKVAEYSRAGNIVTYGRYEQDNNLENGPEPIEWVVLTVDDVQHRSMLISKYGLDTINYGEVLNSKDTTWEGSAARKWLNSFFLYSAFSEEERKAILETEVDNSDSLKNMADKKAEVNNTSDRIYLLSRSEAALYLGAGISWRNEPEEYALCLRARVAPTPYAAAMGAYVNDQFRTAEGLKAGQWLLRTYAGDRQGEPVSQAGTFAGAIPGDTGSGSAPVARPVFWLDLCAVGEDPQLSAEEKKNDENPEEADRKAKKALYSKAGNTVTFGRYEQDNDQVNGPEPIEWIVLTYDEENHRAMLLSKYGLDTLKFDENYRYGQKTIWETCSAREWLNNDFFNNAFSDEEQKAIPMTEVDNRDNLNLSRGQKEKPTNTQDLIFLLSKSEAEVYLGAGRSWRDEPEEYAVCLKARTSPTAYAIAHGALISDQFQTMEGKPAVKWLLRTSDNVYREVMAVNESGTFGDSDPKEKESSSLPVARPALWLDLDADIF